MITNFKVSEVADLNAKTPSCYIALGRFCVIDSENVQHESIPCLFYFTNAHYEVVEYPSGKQGVQFLSTLKKQVLIEFPKTWEGEAQTQGMEVDKEAFFPSTLWKSENKKLVEIENEEWVDVNSLPFPGFYEKEGVFYKV
jgi:hypothetical protein